MIKCFPDLNQTFGKEDINFPVSPSSRSIEWRKNDMSELGQYVYQIDTSMYKDFTINKKYFKDPFIYTLGIEMRDTCYEIYIKQYEQLRTLFVTLCLESPYKYYLNILRMITFFIIFALSMKYILCHIKIENYSP